MQTAMVPGFLNGLAPPLPLARRCYALGQTVHQAIEGWPSDKRVAVLATSSFSLEVTGPGARSANDIWDVPDRDWMHRVVGLLRAGQVEDLLSEATEERMLAAGNVAGELLNWDRAARCNRGSTASFRRSPGKPRSRVRGLALGLSRP